MVRKLGKLTPPRLRVRIDSIDLGLDFAMMLTCKGSSEDRPSVLLTRLAQAVQDGSALDLRQSSELQKLENDIQRCCDAREDMHEFYRQLSYSYQTASVKLHQVKMDYHKEVDHLREMLWRKGSDPHFKPDDVTFFDPEMYTVPSWHSIVHDLDKLRAAREMEAVRPDRNGGSERTKYVAVEMWCKTCKACVPPEEDMQKVAAKTDASSQTDEIFQISRPVQTQPQAQPESQGVQTEHCTSTGVPVVEVSTQIAEPDFYQYCDHDAKNQRRATSAKPESLDTAVQTDSYESGQVASNDSLEYVFMTMHDVDPLQLPQSERPQQRKHNSVEQTCGAAALPSDEIVKVSHLNVSSGGDAIAHESQTREESKERSERTERKDRFENNRQDSGFTNNGKTADQQRELAWRLLERRLVNFQKHMLRHSMAKLHTHAVADSLVTWAGRRPKALTAMQQSEQARPESLPQPGLTTSCSLRARHDLVNAGNSPKMSMRRAQSPSCREDVRSTSKEGHLMATAQLPQKAVPDTSHRTGREKLLPAFDGSVRKQVQFPSLLVRPQSKQTRLPAI